MLLDKPRIIITTFHFFSVYKIFVLTDRTLVVFNSLSRAHYLPVRLMVNSPKLRIIRSKDSREMNIQINPVLMEYKALTIYEVRKIPILFGEALLGQIHSTVV